MMLPFGLFFADWPLGGAMVRLVRLMAAAIPDLGGGETVEAGIMEDAV